MKRSLFALALAAALPFSAQAAELNYTYVEAGYSEISANDLDADTDGFAIKGSMAFNDNFYGYVDYADYDFDGVLKVSPTSLGVGYNKTLGKSNTDFIAEVSYIGMNTKLLDDDFHNDAYRVAVGVRSAVSKHVELEAKAVHTTVENFDSTVGVTVGGLFKFNETWGITASYNYNAFNLDTDFDTWQVGVRASF